MATGQTSGHTYTTTFDPIADGALWCCGDTVPPNGFAPYGSNAHGDTKYNIPVGTTITARIDGATDVVVSPPTITIRVKSSTLGNTTVTGYLDTTDGAAQPSYQFTYAAPLNGCDSTVVAYVTGVTGESQSEGTNSNNAYLLSGGTSASGGKATAGFRFVDASGTPISCGAPAPQDLTVSKTATPSFTRTYTWGIAKSVDQPQINIAAGGSATFNYTVNVTHDSGTDSNWQVNGTITVKNPNTFAVSGVNVTDAVDNGGACTVSGGTGVSLPAGGSTTLSYTCTYASAPSPSSGTNTATATWDQATYGTPHASATGTATFDFSAASATIVDGSVTVSDPLAPANTFSSVSYTDPSPKTFTYSHTFSGVVGTCTQYPNTATFTTNTTSTSGSDSKAVKLCVGADLSVTKDAATSFTRTFKGGITKSVDQTVIKQSGTTATFNYTVNVTHDSGTDSAWQVNGTITVTNPNDWEPISANISDAIDNNGTCTVTGGSNVSVPASGSQTLPYTCTYTSAPSPSSGTNTAAATWDQTAASTPDSSESGTAAYIFGDPTTIVDGSVTVVDTLGGNLGTVSSTNPSPKTFAYPYTVTGSPGTCVTQGNTATFTTNTTSTSLSDSKTVTLCVGKDLTVSKTATPSFTRTYNWKFSKAVDKTLVEQLGGAAATFNYTVNANQTGFTDSGWQVNGTITVVNPNDWEAITANVTDAVDNGGSCTVTGGSSVSVPASGSKTLSYSCTYTSAPSPTSGTNTATATWDKTAASTPDGSATGTASFAFGAPTKTVNPKITVTDTFNSTTTTLGTLTATDAAPFASATYTYPRTVNVPTFNCVTYPNTATLKETGQTASASVEVCGPAKTGALTMGFWQNKNGQAIISGQAKTGTCPSATWLRQFAPFQDLSSTATCSQVATYVYNVIKSADAGGSTMNPMLKGQMLATALDVYFSDGTLGGNKISAPTPIGGWSIDLTHICKMSDNLSTGSGSCSSSFENVSSVFGGATTMKVSDMLAYAASQANSGGSTWYGQDKTKQGLAKDAFDAINNQVAFAP